MALTFKKLHKINSRRSSQFHSGDEWTPMDWGCALAGEVGEACNFIKKLRRLGKVDNALLRDEPNKKQKDFIKEIGKELADVILYADLLADCLGIDLGKAVIEKFNEISDRRGCDIKLEDED
jgi:NTP pyrophosphatase (non-canonical NTP hydrolase)